MKFKTCLLVLFNQSRDSASEFVSSLSAYESSLVYLEQKGKLPIDFVAETYALDSFVNTEIILKLSEVGTIRCKLRFMERKRPNTKYKNTF